MTAPSTRRLKLIQLVGGPLVLGSYVAGFVLWPEATAQMWGGVPDALRGVYTAWMFVAAAGYLFFSWELTFRADPATLRVCGGWGVGAVEVAYAAVLFPSALWLPATAWHIGAPSPARFALIWVVLLFVAAGSVGIIGALLTRQPKPTGDAAPGHRRAVVGAFAFAVQTVVLDALIWPVLWLTG